MKNTLFCPQIYSPGRWKSHFRALEFPPLEKRDQRPFVYTVGYSIRTCWLLQFLLKPLWKGELIANVMWERFLRSSMKRASTIFFFTILTIATFPEKLKTRSDTWLATSQSSSLVWFVLANFWNCVIFGNSSAKSHHAVTGPFYGVEEVLHEAFCNSNAVEACSKTEVWSRDADLQGRNKGMLSRVKPSSPVYSLYIEHTCEENNIKGIDSTQSRSSHINSQR